MIFDFNELQEVPDPNEKSVNMENLAYGFCKISGKSQLPFGEASVNLSVYGKVSDSVLQFAKHFNPRGDEEESSSNQNESNLPDPSKNVFREDDHAAELENISINEVDLLRLISAEQSTEEEKVGSSNLFINIHCDQITAPANGGVINFHIDPPIFSSVQHVYTFSSVGSESNLIIKTEDGELKARLYRGDAGLVKKINSLLAKDDHDLVSTSMLDSNGEFLHSDEMEKKLARLTKETEEPIFLQGKSEQTMKITEFTHFALQIIGVGDKSTYALDGRLEIAAQ